MEKTEWTKGPWEVFICDDGKEWTGWPLSINPAYDEDKMVVRTGGQWPYKWDAATSQREAVANAHLIAAAPELYEALVEAIEELKDYEELASGETYNNPRFNAVLAKARGEA